MGDRAGLFPFLWGERRENARRRIPDIRWGLDLP